MSRFTYFDLYVVHIKISKKSYNLEYTYNLKQTNILNANLKFPSYDNTTTTCFVYLRDLDYFPVATHGHFC
jgi:hypothetical protein